MRNIRRIWLDFWDEGDGAPFVVGFILPLIIAIFLVWFGESKK